MPEIGLQGRLQPADDRVWSLSVSTRRFAQFVSVEVAGFRAADSWFHLEPGGTREVLLHPEREGAASEAERLPRGHLRALNSVEAARISA